MPRKHAGGVELYLHLFLTWYLGVSGLYHALAVLPLGKDPPVPHEVGGPESQFRCFREEKNLLSLPRIELQMISPQHSHYTDQVPLGSIQCREFLE
jgi:hypothetical protein